MLKTHRTLDLEHMRTLEGLAKVRQEADDLTRDMEALKASLSALEARPPSTMTDAEFGELKDGWYRYGKMSNRLEQLRREGDESSYFLSAGNILFKYYDIIDSNSNSTSAQQREDPALSASLPPRAPTQNHARRSKSSAAAIASSSSSLSSSAPRSVISYFTPSPPGCRDAAAAASASASVSESSSNLPTASAVHEMTRVVEDRASLFDKYMQRMNAGSASVSAASSTMVRDVCQHCGSDHRTLQPQDGYVYCNACNTIEYVLVDHEKPAYKDPPKEVTHFAYKRINHLNEWLNQVQGKETTDIPEEVYDRILLEVKKQKINNMATLTRKSVKEILKKLKINKYYEHIPHIINRLNGIPMPQLPPNLEDRVRQMFCQIQVPFLKHAPPHRKNFLSYSYCLNKMMQLLEEDQYLDSFPLLKSREKLHQQDVIWQKICAELGWDFIPSL
jgi:hypothetical protein